MAEDTFVAYAATYDSEDAALSDYEAVREVHRELGIMDFYDASVVVKDEDGRVHISRKHESAEDVDAGIGAGVGLGVGLLTALFPAVALTWGLAVGTAASGAAIGAITGHVTRGISRGDLKDLGDVLDSGKAGLIVLAGVDAEAKVDEAITLANATAKKQLKADRKELDKELEEIENQAVS